MQAHSQELIEDYRKAIDQIIALRARVAELEAKLESWENGCVCTDKSRAKAEAAERERIFGLLNNPSFVLTAAIHHDAEGKAWLGENFLACYLNPTK